MPCLVHYCLVVNLVFSAIHTVLYSNIQYHWKMCYSGSIYLNSCVSIYVIMFHIWVYVYCSLDIYIATEKTRDHTNFFQFFKIYYL